LWFEPSEDPTGLDAATATTYLAELPLDQREAIAAHLWGGLTFEQIAVLVSSSSATVWRRYTAGLAALRERMTLPCRNLPTK
jgi:DNA-directed RNA polymerase specialized sigma24 family protein